MKSLTFLSLPCDSPPFSTSRYSRRLFLAMVVVVFTMMLQVFTLTSIVNGTHAFSSIERNDGGVPSTVVNDSESDSFTVNLTLPQLAQTMYAYPDANVSRRAHRDIHRDNDNETRPWFIFHIGPPKTATTTLQYTLSNYEEEGILARDGYHYAGQYLDDFSENMVNQHTHGVLLKRLKDGNCIQLINKARISGATDWPPCYHHIVQLLTQLRQKNQSVIISEEMISIRYFNLTTDKIGRAETTVDSWDWIALSDMLHSTGWNPLILVGYRRLAEILPSAHQQWERWDPRTPPRFAWPGTKGGGRPPRPLGPVLSDDPRLQDNYHPVPNAGDAMQWSYTDFLVERIAPHIPVRVFTIHTRDDDSSKNDGNYPLSFVSHFFCNILPHAPLTCRQARLDDQKSTIQKTRSQHFNRQESLFYDALACQAAELGWIEKEELSRRQVALRTQAYWEVDLEHKGPYDGLPLICPSKEIIDRLLQRSLEKETKIWGPHLAQTWKDDHEKTFEAARRSFKFCDLDVNTTLEASHWKAFFLSLSSSTFTGMS